MEVVHLQVTHDDEDGRLKMVLDHLGRRQTPQPDVLQAEPPTQSAHTHTLPQQGSHSVITKIYISMNVLNARQSAGRKIAVD